MFRRSCCGDSFPPPLLTHTSDHSLLKLSDHTNCWLVVTAPHCAGDEWKGKCRDPKLKDTFKDKQ